MELTALTDSELALVLPELAHRERVSLVAVLKHLLELERRELFLKLGFGSLFDYCRRKLHYSEGASMRRITAARCMREYPELEAKLVSGEVSLCTIATAASTINAGKLEIADIAGHSKREVEMLVAATRPMSPPPEKVRAIAVAVPATPLLSAKSHISPPPVEKRVELRVSFSEADFQLLTRARDKLVHMLGPKPTFEALILRLAAQALSQPRKVKTRTMRRSRFIPKSIRHEVTERDGGRCTYVAPDGTRCNACSYLELDHIVPYGIGGGNDAENLRLRCAKHNRLAAVEFYGIAKMTQHRVTT